LVISEESEFTVMPALLHIVPIIDFKVASKYEKLVQVFYDYKSHNGDIVHQLILFIEKLIALYVAEFKILDKKIITHSETFKNMDSFLGQHAHQLEMEFSNKGYTTSVVTSDEILKGADNFAHSESFEKSIVLMNNMKIQK
jgi:hypothetical protein